MVRKTSEQGGSTRLSSTQREKIVREKRSLSANPIRIDASDRNKWFHFQATPFQVGMLSQRGKKVGDGGGILRRK